MLNLKDFWIVWIGQDHFFCNGSLYVIEALLMDLVPIPWCLFGSFCFGYFGLTTLYNQWGERCKHIAPSCPEVTVILTMPRKCLSCFTPLGGWIAILPAPYYSEVWYHLFWVCIPGILFQVHIMLIFEPCLVFLDGLQGLSKAHTWTNVIKFIYSTNSN